MTSSKPTWLYLLLLWLGLHSQALAGGSTDAARVIDLLKANQPLWSYFGNTLTFSKAAYGVRCGSHWGFLGGTVMAPYDIEVTPKNDPSTRLWLSIECEQHFFDKSERELPLRSDGEVSDEIIQRASRLEEKVRFVKVLAPEKS